MAATWERMEPFGSPSRQWGVNSATGARVADADIAELYRRAWAPMVRLAKLLVGSDAAAEDLVQDAFVALTGRMGVLDNPDAYLRTAIVNGARGVHRRAQTAKRHSPEPPMVTGEPQIDETWQAVGKLPYRQRAALVLRFYADLPEAEIAQALRCRPGTVKSAIHRGLARLREELE